MTPPTIKKTSARKSLCISTKILDTKKKTSTRQVGADKSKRKTIKSGTTPCALKPNLKVNSIINNNIKKYLYNWIMHHPQLFQSPIVNYCMKLIIDGQTIPQIVTKLLLQVYIRELHNRLVSDT